MCQPMPPSPESAAPSMEPSMSPRFVLILTSNYSQQSPPPSFILILLSFESLHAHSCSTSDVLGLPDDVDRSVCLLTYAAAVYPFIFNIKCVFLCIIIPFNSEFFLAFMVLEEYTVFESVSLEKVPVLRYFYSSFIWLSYRMRMSCCVFTECPVGHECPLFPQ